MVKYPNCFPGLKQCQVCFWPMLCLLINCLDSKLLPIVILMKTFTAKFEPATSPYYPEHRVFQKITHCRRKHSYNLNKNINKTIIIWASNKSKCSQYSYS